MYNPSPKTETCWRRIVQAYAGIFGPQLRAVVAHGSAVKGGLIPGWSDFDISVFLSPDAFGPVGLPCDKALAAQAAVDSFGVIEAGYSYYQAFFYNADALPDGWVGYFPGAYRLLHGELPAGALATEERARLSSERHLRQAACFLAARLEAFAESHDVGVPGRDVSARLRYLCTQVTPLMFSAVALASGDALKAWSLDKFQALDLFQQLYPGCPASEHLRRFFRILSELATNHDDLTKMKQAYVHGLHFLQWCADLARGLSSEGGQL